MNNKIFPKEYHVNGWITTPLGVKRHLLYNKLHCADGPAVIWPDGGVEYRIHGELHRENGPAVIRADGSEHYYLNGKYYNREDWCKELTKDKDYSVILLRTGKLPEQNVLIKAFQNLFSRPPTNEELSSIKIDAANENVIIVVKLPNK